MTKQIIKSTAIRTDKNSLSRKREIVTPEGVPLTVYLASRGDRVAGVVIDFIIIAIMVIGVSLLAMFIISQLGGASASIFFSLSYFFLRSFYFIFFELKWRGQTPGKRYSGMRVVKRSGGRLDTGAIFARNLMREVEIFLPVSLLMVSSILGLDGWMVICIWLWCGIMMLMPFFNKDNLRVGDIVGGTWVISVPKTELLPDVGKNTDTKKDKDVERPALIFTKQQMDVYGIYELHTLENVLRSPNKELHKSVIKKIQKKIGWKNEQYYQSDIDFLREFYTAMRKHHEGEILMGRRKENKHSK